MPRSQKSNRRRSTITSVKQKQKGIGKKVGERVARSQRFQASELDYDQKQTQFANYARLGLAADANQIGAVKESITGFKPRVKVPKASAKQLEAAAAAAAAANGAHPLELEVPEGLKTIRQVPDGERQVLLKLQAVHGTDYAAMARNMRLNPMQHTAAWLRKRIAKLQSEDDDEAAAVQEAVAKGAAAPPPRHRKKMTKHPNDAFHKRSKNFI
mmetsp:Transcript_22869/g.58157  ORF Transcript_22869/g.58157 Transcript_22869/m.58157 type:complete len:213 (-) Transcript_22869:412-1050(-)|eukprot:CAMPEP_0115849504 /NCGR_PEP_ID=MMETSP0287-20121206/11485_1 /TAXON_ID=412157 /ORGANISM="Chrysochromulina rotalis, Strain UIO044" /LENGTH=212 /DNA_ID=CAMNT_0003303477 /DNA_START=31 /DNA_END=669 /DNA_ORIENTATION=+